jgi:hypothetical protein
VWKQGTSAAAAKEKSTSAANQRKQSSSTFNKKRSSNKKMMADVQITKKSRMSHNSAAATAAASADDITFVAISSAGDKVSGLNNGKRTQQMQQHAAINSSAAAAAEDQHLKNLELLVQGKSPSLAKVQQQKQNNGINQNQRFHTIKTNIPTSPKEIRDQVFSVVTDHFDDAATPLVIFGGNYNTTWPNVRLTLRGANEDTENPKYFGMILPSNLDSGRQEKRKPLFTLRKGLSTDNNDTLILFDETVVQGLLAHSDDIFKYLKSIEGLKITDLSHVPKKPESWVLEKSQTNGDHLVLQIDDMMPLNSGNQFLVKPNISLRVWKRKENGGGKNWYMTKMGVTMSAYSFFLFVEATLKTFVPELINCIDSSFAPKLHLCASKFNLKNQEKEQTLGFAVAHSIFAPDEYIAGQQEEENE